MQKIVEYCTIVTLITYYLSMALPQILTRWTTTQLVWYYDGAQMISSTADTSSAFAVPANYASKSKLIPWDKLKLIITAEGEFIYKLISPAPRKHLKGILHRKKNIFLALWSDNKNYTLNAAAVTYFGAQCGDEVCLVINDKEPYNYAALEQVLKW